MKYSIPVFDSHFHIIDPDFPLVENHGYLPDPFTVERYLKQMKSYQLAGGVVVTGSFQAFDQSYLTHALKKLGKAFVGVTQLPSNVGDMEILALKERGIKAVRFNLKRGGSEKITALRSFATRIYELAGWHIELYIDSSELSDIKNLILSLPKVSIDHLGLRKKGLKNLFEMVENGIAVKATGFGRTDFNVLDNLRIIHAVNPDALMFGTDLPSTRAPRIYQHRDFELVADNFDESEARKILYLNAMKFYGVTDTESSPTTKE